MIQTSQVKEMKSWQHAYELFDSLNINTHGIYTLDSIGTLSSFVSDLFIQMYVYHPEAFKQIVKLKDSYIEKGNTNDSNR